MRCIGKNHFFTGGGRISSESSSCSETCHELLRDFRGLAREVGEEGKSGQEDEGIERSDYFEYEA